MLVKIRKGVFETNSSSTHSFTFKKAGQPADRTDNEYEIKFKIVSLEHKFLFMYGVIDCYYREHGRRKDIKDLHEILIEVYSNIVGKTSDEVEAFVKNEIKKDKYTRLCARYFNNDVLMECFCCAVKFCKKRWKHDLFAKFFEEFAYDYKVGFEKLLSDEYYIDLTEDWCGGSSEKEDIEY